MKRSTLGFVLVVSSFFGQKSFVFGDDANPVPSTNVPNTAPASVPLETSIPAALTNNGARSESDLQEAGMHRPRRYEFAKSAVPPSTSAAGIPPALHATETSPEVGNSATNAVEIVTSSASGAPATLNPQLPALPELLKAATLPLSIPSRSTTQSGSVVAQPAQNPAQSEDPLINQGGATTPADQPHLKKVLLGQRTAQYVMRADPQPKVAAKTTNNQNQTTPTIDANDIGEQQVGSTQKKAETERGDAISPVLPELSKAATTPSIVPAPEALSSLNEAQTDRDVGKSTADQRHFKTKQLGHRMAEYALRADPQSKVATKSASNENQTTLAINGNDIGQQQVRSDQKKSEAKNGNVMSPVLPELLKTATVPSNTPSPAATLLSATEVQTDQNAIQAERPLMEEGSATISADQRHLKKYHLSYRMAEHAMRPDPQPKVALLATNVNDQLMFAIARNDILQQQIRSNQNNSEAENDNKTSPALPALSRTANLPSIILTAAKSPASSTGLQTIQNAGVSDDHHLHQGLQETAIGQRDMKEVHQENPPGLLERQDRPVQKATDRAEAAIDHTSTSNDRKDESQQTANNQDQDKLPGKNPLIVSSQEIRTADTRKSTSNDRPEMSNQGHQIWQGQRKSPADSSNKSHLTILPERGRKIGPTPTGSGKDVTWFPKWLWVSMLFAFGYLWLTQFLQLILMSHHDFARPRDKQIWVAGFFLLFAVAPFAFLAWKSGCLEFDLPECESSEQPGTPPNSDG